MEDGEYRIWPCGRKQLLSGPWRAHRSSWSCRARTDGWRPTHDTSQGNPRCDLWLHATLCETPPNTKSAKSLIFNQLIKTHWAELINVLWLCYFFLIISLVSKCLSVHMPRFYIHLFQLDIYISNVTTICLLGAIKKPLCCLFYYKIFKTKISILAYLHMLQPSYCKKRLGQIKKCVSVYVIRHLEFLLQTRRCNKSQREI